MRDLINAPGADGGRDAILRFDIDKNGEITREEMNSALAADFIVADVNGDKKLDAEETRLANEKRWAIEASQSTPLIDWNQDGFVTMGEFSNSALGLLERFDLDSNGTVSKNELNARLPRTQDQNWRNW